MDVEGSLFWMICSIIVLIGSTVTALATLYNIFKKPAEKLKDKQKTETKELIKEVLQEILPTLLKQHDLETKDRYRADRARYLQEIKSEVLEDTRNELEQIKVLKLQYDALVISAKDVLREKIVKIYLDNKDTRTLSVLEKEKVTQFYKDYKALNGNSYIDKYYSRISKWKVIEETDDYIDDIV